MATLLHGVAWVGIPGLCLGAKKLFSGAFSVGEGEREAPRLSEELIKGLTEGFARSVARGHQPSEVHHYHHQEQKRDANVPAEEESPENSDDDDETKLRKRRNKRKREREKKEPKVAPHEPASTGLWVTLIAGTACSFYFTYEWAYDKCKSICNSVQGRVENIN
jgi:hypothetical protein